MPRGDVAPGSLIQLDFFALRKFDLEDTEFESANSNTTAKLLILKLALKQEIEAIRIFLPPEWNTHVVVWMNKPEVDTMSIDDLYNNFKIIEQKVKKSIEQIHEDDLEAMDLKWQLSLLSMRAKRYYQKTCKKIIINANDTAGYDKSKVECFNCHKMGHFARECRAPRSKEDGECLTRVKWQKTSSEKHALMQFSDSEGIDLVPPPHPLIYNKPKKLDLSYSGLDEFKEHEFKGYGPENSKQESNIVCDKKSDDSKENSDNSLVKEQVSKDTSSFVESSLNVDKETIFPVDKKVESVKPKNHEKPVKKSVRYAEMYRSQTPRGNQRNWNGQKSNQLGSDFVMYNKACFICGSFNHVQAQCKYHQREGMVYGNTYKRVNYNYTTNRTHPNAQRNMVPRAVLMKTGLKTFNTARTVNTAHPKSIVFSAKPISCFSKTAQSTVRRPFQTKTTLTNKRFTHKVNTAKAQAVNTARPQAVNTARPKTVKTARPNSAVVNAVRVNQANVVKASACWVWRPTKPDSASITLKKHNYIDARGRSKISGKGTLKTDSLDFEDLLDESQILLKILRKDNMYSFKMKNIVPKETLTCLVANATSDESILWHRRLGHINFKNINKLVKDNLVRGLPTKHFENDQTCVACLKEKQHRASCKSKVLNLITKPLFMLHMDLFGLTFMSSLMHKKYCLVVTDNYSKFTWVFFLATKDETSEILKNFIKEIENLVDKKVKIIRSNNGTEFKNKVMDDFCRKKGIKKEYSLAKTPRQNGVAERRNRTLIEAAKPILICSTLPPHFGSKAISTSTQKEEISQDYIVMPIWKDVSYFDSPSKDVGNNEPKSVTDDQKQVEDGPDNENDEKDKSEDDSSPKEVNAAGQHVNTASPEVNTGRFKLNTVDPSVSTASSNDQDSPKDMFKLGASHTLETTHVEFFSDEDEPEVDLGNITNSYTVLTTPNTRIHKDYPIKNVIGDVWKLVDLPNGKRAIGTKWVIRNKKDERGIVIKNKARLVAQGHRQEEGIAYEEVFALVTRIEAIRLFLAYASFMGFLVYQMDVKSALLYRTIKEEVYVTQPPGFKDPNHPDKVYKVVKALYGLHQALRAWYETLANYLLGNGFKRGKIDQTLFIKKQKEDILLVQFYVDDIIFGSTNKELCIAFEKLMKDKFQMSSIGELTFFIGLQVTQKEDVDPTP
ncbi:putative ribonuclease H-like domain-containing protein [Tanacetum coccineum]|uniref:Ribonuclease H-like domain-containing protein n=1 Tax=Tanacetum coccineum TaxID=301880 RepID=A0ABQ5BS99_9ASTR